ncbi:soluble inorganic pyrophosphatase [Striga asiatica]|uniref:Soluble inorganic pyrophosphatase n=1 Tax=Striga asiatica TaxID=4170 RepID=A0A5A7PSW9_STRAF|nr:soluble inorganic pyrophosphatase [Striga asiatica]
MQSLAAASLTTTAASSARTHAPAEAKLLQQCFYVVDDDWVTSEIWLHQLRRPTNPLFRDKNSPLNARVLSSLSRRTVAAHPWHDLEIDYMRCYLDQHTSLNCFPICYTKSWERPEFEQGYDSLTVAGGVWFRASVSLKVICWWKLENPDGAVIANKVTCYGSKGLKNKLLKEGDGWENFKCRNEVEGFIINVFFFFNFDYHFLCRRMVQFIIHTSMDRTQFHSSLTPLKFNLGQGTLKGCSNMRSWWEWIDH